MTKTKRQLSAWYTLTLYVSYSSLLLGAQKGSQMWNKRERFEQVAL